MVGRKSVEYDPAEAASSPMNAQSSGYIAYAEAGDVNKVTDGSTTKSKRHGGGSKLTVNNDKLSQ